VVTNAITPTTSGTFVNGAWTGDVTAQTTLTQATLRADDGAGHTGDSGAFSAEEPPPPPPELDHFTWSAIGSPQTVGVPFGVTVTARDADGNAFTGFTGTVSLSALEGGQAVSGGITPTQSGTFVDGTWAGQITAQTTLTQAVLRADDGSGHTGDSGAFSAEEPPPPPPELDHFTWLAVGATQTVGVPFGVAVTARDVDGNAFTEFTGTVSLSVLEGGQAVSGGITPTQSGAFVNGTWTSEITAQTTLTQAVLRADDGAGHTGDSGAFSAELPPPELDHFTFGAIGTTQTVGTPFSVTITARDANGDAFTEFTGTVALSALEGSQAVSGGITPTQSGAFAGGVWTGDVTAQTTLTQAVLHAADGAGHMGDSEAFSTTGAERLSILDLSTEEGDNGVNRVSVTVTLSEPTDHSVTVEFATFDGTATAGSDYETKTGTVTFNPGTTVKSFSVKIFGDRESESNEVFEARLSNPTGAALENDLAEVTIQNDDGGLMVGFASSAVSIPEDETPSVNVTVTLSEAAAQEVTVDYATEDGTAGQPDDYLPASGTLTFAPGETEQSFTVTIVDDELKESTETFTVTLSNAANAMLGTANFEVSITDSDPPEGAVLAHLLHKKNLTDEEQAAADVNGDGVVDVADLVGVMIRDY
jgi:hypothetical protein